MMVTEFVSRGNLSKLLHISRDPISLATRLSIAMECAEALNYMHSMYRPIIHGDIKPENILVDDDLGAKLSDFGISRLLSMDRTQYTNNVIGSIGYVDPEFILKGRIDPKNDVYSFGVVLLELITRKKICENRVCTYLIENFMKAFEKGKKLREMLDSEIANVDSRILNKVGMLVTDCLKSNFNERPDMKDVVQRLHMLTKSDHEQGTASSKVIRNVSPTLVQFKMVELRPFFKRYLFMGRGHSSEIYKGYLGLGDEKCLVAIKRSICRKNDKFANEIVIQSQIYHKNILKLIGCCVENGTHILVFEFASKGSLNDILHGVDRIPLSLDARLHIAAQIARGLAYMHSEITTTIWHGDVRPEKILLSDDLVPKISGFGISTRLVAPDRQYTDRVIGDRGYIDPVYMQTGLLTRKSDVFSFGVVLLELITRRKDPVPDSNQLLQDFRCAYRNMEVIQLVDPEIATTENIELLYSIKYLIMECLNLDVDQRPEMTDVAMRLHMLIKANHQSDGRTIYSTSNSTQVYGFENFDIFSRTARGKFINNSSPILQMNSICLFRKEELKHVFSNLYKVCIDGSYQKVAVRKHNNMDLRTKEEITNEVNIQCRVIHKNILRLIGVCLEDDIPIIVFEWASRGSLSDILHGVHWIPLSLDARLHIAAQTARGLAYMHSEITMMIRHGAVRPDNILISDDLVPKISGFGLSTRLVARDRQYTNTVIGDICYMDPVYLQTGLLTSKSDVFSFGVVLLELITRRKNSVPDSNQLLEGFFRARRNVEVIQLVDPEIATTENIELLYSITEIIVQCLNLDVDQRPEMTYVAECLQETLKRSQGKQVGLSGCGHDEPTC